ncbi:kinase-like domain-containing protein [Halenospora varia]|nr:kinase-like domain-containing protein [Halenospora varia]
MENNNRRKKRRATELASPKFQDSLPSSSTSRQSPILTPPQSTSRLQQLLVELRRKIIQGTVNRTPRQRFITSETLERIWTWEVLTEVLTLLSFADSPELISLVGIIRSGLLQTLSILVQIQWQDWASFRERFLETRPGTLRHDRKDSALPHLIEAGKNKVYSRDKPLPFIQAKQAHLGSGGYGIVTKEFIACRQFKSEPYDWEKDEVPVARKQFQAKGDFRKESENLRKIHQTLSGHSRIVKYLAIFTIEDEHDRNFPKQFNILMDLADIDLTHFLLAEEFRTRCGGVVQLLKEASALADAIAWLHRSHTINDNFFVWCHGDLKPDNVLVYFKDAADVGFWKISDFGISSLIERREEQSSRPRTPAFLNVPGAAESVSPAESLAIITGREKAIAQRHPGPYSAPEVEKGHDIGPESDIWSFGCILFQILLRAAGGIELLMELDNKRAAYKNGSTNDHFCQRTAHAGIHLHPSVIEWLQNKNNLSCGSYPDRMMVVDCKNIILRALHLNPKLRPGANWIHEELVKVSSGKGKTSLSVDDLMQSKQPGHSPEATTHAWSSAQNPTFHVTEPVPDTPKRGVTNLTQQQESINQSSSDFSEHSPIGVFRMVDSRLTEQQPLTPQPEASVNQKPSERGWHQRRDPESLSSADTSISSLEARNSEARSMHASPEVFPSGYFPRTGTNSSSSQQVSQVWSIPLEVPRPAIRNPGTNPFHTPADMVTTVVSPEAELVAFVSGTTAFVSTTYSPYSSTSIPAPSNYKWNQAGFAGYFLALRGTTVTSSRSMSTTIFRLYHLSYEGSIIKHNSLAVPSELPSFEMFSVSQHGNLIIATATKVWLCQTFCDLVQQLNVDDMTGAHIQNVWFSTDCSHSFARFLLPNGKHYIRMWRIKDGDLVDQIHYKIVELTRDTARQ